MRGYVVRMNRKNITLVMLALVAALLCGAGFLVFQGILVDNSLADFRPRADAYSSIYYTLIGVHYVHVVVGMLLGVWALLRSGRFTPERHLTLQVTALYWHFVNVIAASRSGARIRLTTGPKISSRPTNISGVTSSKIVGPMKQPRGLWGTV